MTAAYFAEFDTVRYEGPASTSDLAYRWYDKDRVVFGKRMEDYLRFAVCFWHTFCWPGSDVFGAGTFERPWLLAPQDEAAARAKREAALAEDAERLQKPRAVRKQTTAKPRAARQEAPQAKSAKPGVAGKPGAAKTAGTKRTAAGSGAPKRGDRKTGGAGAGAGKRAKRG